MPTDKKTEMITGKHVFTADELKDIASKMARKVQEQASAEDEKKSVISSFKATLDLLIASINKLSENYRNGYDYRQIECNLTMDFDKKLRLYANAETGEIVREEPIRPEDYQTSIPEVK